MSKGNSYVNEINSLEAEIKRLNKRLKELRETKRNSENNLYMLMKSENIDQITYEGRTISIEKITPKNKKKILPKKQRDELTKNYLRDQGIPDPEEIFQEIQRLKKLTVD